MVSELPIGTQVALWAACRHDMPHIRDPLLSTVSRYAVHYGIGGAIHPMTMQSIWLRSGLSLGTITVSNEL
jgi:hypothetical protein